MEPIKEARAIRAACAGHWKAAERAAGKMVINPAAAADFLRALTEYCTGRRRIQSAVDIMPADDAAKLVFELRYLLFKSWDTIAADMGTSKETVYRLHRLNLAAFLRAYREGGAACDE